MIKNKKIISLSIFMSLGLLGLLFPAVGASLPGIEKYFNVGLSSSGIVSSLVQLGYALFCFTGGILSDFFGKKRVLVIGAFIYGASGILLAFSQSWMLTTALFFIFGSGSGLIFIASNTLVIDIFPKKPGTFLNIHHTFFSLGSLIAPIIVRSLLMNGFSWFSIFRILGFMSLGLGIIILLSRMDLHTTKPSLNSKTTDIPLKIRYQKVLKEKRFIRLLVIVFLAIGVQFGIIYLLVSFLIKVRELDFGDASLVMSAFFALILLGRLSCSYLVSRISSYRVVLVLLVMLVLTLIFGWLTRGAISYVLFALTGLASSGLMPTLISIASSTLEPEIRASALGLLSMAGGIGGMVVTLSITELADYIGFNNSFTIMIVLSIISVILFVRIIRTAVKV
ncbi:MAG TPA: hypothetical protein DCO79_16690 [Spirochaeta sp.]|nr:hypothetical protein [Spirochaeta sp.]